jgi:hypothetical protein
MKRNRRVSVEGKDIELLDRNPPQLLLEKVQRIVKDLFGISGDFKLQVNERNQFNRIKAPHGETYVFYILTTR